MMTTASGGGPAVTVGARGRDVVSRAPRAMRGARTSVGGSFAPSGARASGGRSRSVGTARIAVEGLSRAPRRRRRAGRGKGRRRRAREREGREENR